MARLQVIFIIISSSVLRQTYSANNIYSAVLPHTVTALTGSCVQIPCTFSISDFKQKLHKKTQIYGMWLKHTPFFDKSDSLVVFNSSQNITKGFSHIEMIGNLSKGNCTTVFYDIMMNHTDHYYFRLQMEPDVFKATFYTNPRDSSDSSSTVRITVIDSPQSPELKNHSKTVMEGTAFNLTCSAEAPCPKQPPTLSWSNIPESANITTQLQEKPNKTQSVFSRMTFIASYIHHKQNISCNATYSRNNSNDTTVNSSIMLKVLFSPKETHVTIQPSASVSVGNNVTLTCRSKASPSNGMNFTWYKRGQKTPVARTKNMTFSVTENNTGWYFCIVQNKHGNQSSKEIQLTDRPKENHTEDPNGSSKSVIYGCTGGLLAFLVLCAVFVYCMRTRALRQTSIRGRDQADSKEMEAVYSHDVIMMKKSEISEQEDDNLHYGEIDFSTRRTNCVTRKDPVETEYAEVRTSERKRQINAQQQEGLYVQMMKK